MMVLAVLLMMAINHSAAAATAAAVFGVLAERVGGSPSPSSPLTCLLLVFSAFITTTKVKVDHTRLNQCHQVSSFFVLCIFALFLTRSLFALALALVALAPIRTLTLLDVRRPLNLSLSFSLTCFIVASLLLLLLLCLFALFPSLLLLLPLSPLFALSVGEKEEEEVVGWLAGQEGNTTTSVQQKGGQSSTKTSTNQEKKDVPDTLQQQQPQLKCRARICLLDLLNFPFFLIEKSTPADPLTLCVLLTRIDVVVLHRFNLNCPPKDHLLFFSLLLLLLPSFC